MIRIVVVDDNQPTLELLQEFGKQQGWTIVGCTAGAGAVETIEREQPALVLLDIWLETRTSGWEILRQLRAGDRTRHIPVVVTSGGVEDLEDHRDLIENLAAAVLVKPFTLEDVERCLEFALARSS